MKRSWRVQFLHHLSRDEGISKQFCLQLHNQLCCKTSDCIAIKFGFDQNPGVIAWLYHCRKNALSAIVLFMTHHRAAQASYLKARTSIFISPILMLSNHFGVARWIFFGEAVSVVTVAASRSLSRSKSAPHCCHYKQIDLLFS